MTRAILRAVTRLVVLLVFFWPVFFLVTAVRIRDSFPLCLQLFRNDVGQGLINVVISTLLLDVVDYQWTVLFFAVLAALCALEIRRESSVRFGRLFVGLAFVAAILTAMVNPLPNALTCANGLP
jgi:hypothetical protein